MRERGGAPTTAGYGCGPPSDQSGGLLAVRLWFWENGDGTVRGAHALEEAYEHAADLDDVGDSRVAFQPLDEIRVTTELEMILDLGA